MKWPALLLVLGMSWGCEDKKRSEDSTPAWEDDSQAKPIGPIYEDPDFVLSAQRPRTCSVSGPMAPQYGQKRLSVPVEVRALSEREVQISPLLFTLQDDQGHQFRATLATCGTKFPGGEITQGEIADGEIAFDVPSSFHAGELLYEPFLIGRKKVSARITLLPPAAPETKSAEPPPEETAPSK